MELPTSSDIHTAWRMERDRMIAKHKSDLSLQDDLVDALIEELRSTKDKNLRELKDIVSSKLYRDVILPMAEKSLNYDMREIHADHEKRVKLIKNKHAEALAQHESLYREKPKAAFVSETQSTMNSGALSNLPRSTDDWNDHVSPPEDSKKRKASTSEEARPKRLRVDTSVDQVRTPAPTPSDEPTHSPKRTVTFHQVYQNGNAKHKDTIVEWPTGSQRWYILKCVEHGLRFTRRPVQGAAKHLNGNGHGREDRNRDYAVRALGYLVTDCNEHLASLNNRVAEEAYARGYKPLFSRLKKQRNHARDSSNKHAGERGVAKAGTQSTFQNAPDSWNGITHPKTFRIYYGRWKGDSFGNEQGDQIYPVMILGWGSQNGSGLKDSDLDTTGLLKRKSKPPKCYIYESHRIAGWAPGYEDGGPKVRLRRFPVMFFDESQTVGWLPAQDLMKFPLNKRNAPAEPDHPFNAARRWVAEREGFKTWEEREKARIDANPPSVSPITPAGSTNEASHANLADGIGPDDWVSETSANSTATEKMMQDLRENGGEKTDDEDYVASHPGSDIDESLECEIDDWNRSAPSTTKHDSTTNRPWAFHGLRSTENINGPKPSVGSICQVQGNGPAGSSTAGISSERQLTIQECSSAADSRDPYITHISALAQSPERSRPMTQDPDQSDKRKPSDHTQIRNDNLAQSIAETLDFRNDMIAHLGQVDENLSLKSTHDVVIEVPSTSPCTNLTGNRLIRDDNRTEGDVLIDNTSASDHTVSRDANPVVNVMVSHLHGGSHGAENSEPLDVEGQATCHTNETVHDNQDSTSGAMGNRECVLPKGDSIGDSISSSTQPLANVRNAASGTPGLPSADVDFELSFYTNGDVSWEKANEEDGCLQLFHSADKKRVSTRQGPIAISIDPVEIVSFSRERDTLMGSKESTVFVLRHKDGSSSRLVFDRSRGSKLGNGKLQTRSFIKWLRVVKPDIACF
ncbi:hypothetical protein F5B19DRAFT_427836 [Rostrohypoxylon terebratum]|nr:hypothetical protein F5B19DRAFT_427836 [Rostrohypoxylon terebratum]